MSVQHDGTMPIHHAAQHGYLDCVKYILDRTPDLTEDQVSYGYYLFFLL